MMQFGLVRRAIPLRLGHFFALTQREQSQVLRALPVVAGIRAALWLLPYRVVQPIPLRAKRARTTQGQTPAELAQAVSRASQVVPGATCLTQALSAQYLLARSGYESELVIGAAWNRQHEFEAHAWLVRHGETLIGGGPAPRFVPLKQQ